MNLIQTLEAEAIEALTEAPSGPRIPPRRHAARRRQGRRRRARPRPEFRRRVHRPLEQGHRLQLHRPQDQLRRRRRARLPALFAGDRFDRGRPPRRRPPRQALLSARPHRQIGAHRRAPRSASAPRAARSATAKTSADIRLETRPGLPTWRSGRFVLNAERKFDMASGYRVVVVGATGNVGREMLNILAERQFPLDEIAAVAQRALDRRHHRLRRQRQEAQGPEHRAFRFRRLGHRPVRRRLRRQPKVYAPARRRGGLHGDRQ